MLAAGKWVVEEGVLPFLYCATLHTAQADVVAHVLTPHPGQPNCLKALVQYLEEEMQAVLGTVRPGDLPFYHTSIASMDALPPCS